MTGNQLSQCSAYITDDTEVGRRVRRGEPRGRERGRQDQAVQVKCVDYIGLIFTRKKALITQ